MRLPGVLDRFRGAGYRRLIGGGGALFSLRVGGAVLTYGTQVLLARWIGREQLGHYVEVFSWCLILSTVAMLGLGTSAIRFVPGYIVAERFGAVRGYISSARRIVFVVSTALAAVAATVAIGLGLVGRESGIDTVILGMACVPGLAWLRLHGGVAHALSWFALAFVPNIILRPGLLVAAVALAHAIGWLDSAADVMALHLAAIFVAILAQDATLVPRVRRIIRDAVPERENRFWLRASAPLLLVTLFTQYFPEINVVVLGAFVADADVAVFNAGIRTSMFIGFGLTAIDALNLPSVSRMHAGGDRAGMQRILVHSTRLKVVAALLAVGFLALVGRPILGLFGPEFVSGYPALLVLTTAHIVRAAVGPVGEVLSITGHQNKCLVVYAVTLAAMAGLHPLLLPVFGITGGALTVLLATSASSLALHWILVRTVGVCPSIIGRTRAR